MGSTLFAPIIFFFVSFVFSMLGRGGGTLYVPILFWLGMNLKTQAIPLSILLGLTTSSTATFTYGLKKEVDWKLALPFGATMVAFAPLGARINLGMSPESLILIFAVFTILATIPLLKKNSKRTVKSFNLNKGMKVGTLGGSLLGFLAGLIGRGGGSFTVPLFYLTGQKVKNAAATSSFVVACAGISSFISHVAMHAKPSWGIWISCVIAVLAGSRLGSRFMIDRLSDRQLRIIFVSINLSVATMLLIKDVILS